MLAPLAAVLLLVPAADPPKLSEAAQKELKKLEGKWQIQMEARSDGERDRSGDSDAVVEFKGHKIVAEGKDFGEVAALDPSTDPKCLDLKVDSGPAKGRTVEAIYKIDGDTLTLCVGIMEKMRPSGFDKPKDAGFVLVTLKRIKE
jgi:uncharacterized protein (TIGR03067 family)